jgi:hypothetical protein
MLPAIQKGKTEEVDPNVAPDVKPHEHKTLFEGTKNFWRTGENVDIRIIEHIDAHALEIIGFSIERYEEADRLFCDARRIFKKVDDHDIEERLVLKREELNRQRKRVPNEEIKAGLIRDAAVQYIFNRLNTASTKKPRKSPHLILPTGSTAATTSATTQEATEATTVENTATTAESETQAETSEEHKKSEEDATQTHTGESHESAVTEAEGHTVTDGIAEIPAFTGKSTGVVEVVEEELAEPRFAIELVILTGDRKDPTTGLSEMLLTEEPTNIEHIKIIRQRKKASNKEFHAAVKALKQDAHKLTLAMSDAQRKAGLAVSSVEGFQNFLSRSTYDPSKMSIAKWRWLKAGRRVILQNAVKAYTKRLERYSMGEAPSTEKEQQDAFAKAAADAKASRRRMKPSASTTRLPSLKESDSKTGKGGRASFSKHRIARGSRELRPLDDFSSALSGAIKSHSDAKLEGRLSFDSTGRSSFSGTPLKPITNHKE